LTTTVCIYADPPHPDGDFLVREYHIAGLNTFTKDLGRAATLEAARALVPPAPTQTRVDRREGEDTRLVETWL
jgi:hypothetical protein